MAKVSALRTESVRDQVSDEEWAVRVDLAALYRVVAHFGWDDLIFEGMAITDRVAAAEHWQMLFQTLFQSIDFRYLK